MAGQRHRPRFWKFVDLERERYPIVKLGVAPATAASSASVGRGQRCDRAWATGGRRAPRRELSNFDLSAVCVEHVLHESTTNSDMEPSSHVYSAKIGPHNSLCGDGFDADQTAGGFATGSGARVIDGIGCSSLGAGSRQAGGRDRHDQGNTASDPRRRGAQQGTEFSHIAKSFCASRNHRFAKRSAE